MVGGYTPKFLLTPSDTGTGHEMITPGQTGGKGSLQLDPIKFRQCSATTAIDFLLDRSGSMQGQKIAKLKEGVLSFADKMSDDSIVGMQDFSSPENPSGTVKVLVSFSYLKDVRSSIPNLIKSMNAGGNTYTKTAFIFAKGKLDETIPKFPSKYKFNLIFLSDGVPHTPKGDFDPDQMPNEIATQIKNENITIYTIAYSMNESKGLALMKELASSPENAFTAPSPSDLDKILNQIAVKICAEP
jgi:uncharacterized protein YegL